MLKKRGITRHTFLFTSLLISLVIVISFGILYIALPDYYFYSKHKKLEDHAENLVTDIKSAHTQKEINELIKQFSALNNAHVTVYDEKDELIVELSTPFSLYVNHLGDLPRVRVKIQDNSDNHDTYKKREVIIMRNKVDSIELRKDIGVHDIGFIKISGTMQPINEAKNVIISLIPYLLLVDILIALIAAYLYSKKITKPIVALSDTARHMQTLTPGITSGLRTKDELGELSENLDLLYEKLCSNIENLKKEKDKVTELEKSKTDFMRAASHELKTPISALNGIVEGMIDNVGVYKDKEQYLLKSKKLIDNLSYLLNEILEASKLHVNESLLKMEPINLQEIIKGALEDNQLFIDEKQLYIDLEEIHYRIESDYPILKTVISNIVSNAVRYTVEKGIIRISMTDEADFYCLSVENQCEKIPENDLQKLFEPFYTRNYSRTKDKSGTGLGLYIVKGNLEKLGLPYTIENTSLGFTFNIYFEKTAQ
ncbi:ATP-binding protein [Schinkia azotoformans]|uniref:ATP-binding protein n=1 Tax=Schinkia azotoformans TaxID=1454 RepID=UPI002DBF7FDA|nr:ATP-binding protein [Schinkia azotoformans]MEC1722560.1 ATP-binding protein [Schinkia azotoformans]MED4411549.1 ATP-binding protein [Schinkia azotoformans]